jgi:hypothetical protein
MILIFTGFSSDVNIFTRAPDWRRCYGSFLLNFPHFAVLCARRPFLAGKRASQRAGIRPSTETGRRA